MRWSVLRPALDLLLDSRRRTVDLNFTGGEPLLAFPLVRRAVGYVLEHKRDRLAVRLDLTTNGTLVGPRHISFLARHDFQMAVSADGAAPAQRFRGPGTFEVLDPLFARLRREQPEWFERRVSVAATLIAPTVRLLPGSIRYLLSTGARTIELAAALTHQASWRRDDIRVLDEQFARVFDVCLAHYRRTGLVPLPVFRKRRSERRPPAPSPWFCGAADGRDLTLDVNGELSGCVLFARSYRRNRATPLGGAIENLRLGSADGENLRTALAGYEDCLKATGLFHNRAAKHSSYGRCATCTYRRECSPCPVSIVNQPGNEDPDRIPDFICAFHRVTAKYRRRFPGQ